jgi:hypothetical protein
MRYSGKQVKILYGPAAVRCSYVAYLTDAAIGDKSLGKPEKTVSDASSRNIRYHTLFKDFILTASAGFIKRNKKQKEKYNYENDTF